MKVKTFIMLCIAAIIICGCAEVAHGDNDILLSVTGDVTGDKIECYAFHTNKNGGLEFCFHDVALRQDSDAGVVKWAFTAKEDHKWAIDHKVAFYAFTPCDGVRSVMANKKEPLSLEYTTNADLSKQGDLLIARTISSAQDSTVTLEFKHALSRLSFVWDAKEDIRPETKYKLRKLTIWAKQSGRMTFLPNDSMPRWSLITAVGDHPFVVYECPDYHLPDSLRKYQNPDEELLKKTNSLYLAPGTAVAADVEYSVWHNNIYAGTLSATNLVLGGRENTAAFIEWNTHYTYIFSPNDEGEPAVKIKMNVKEWANGPVHSESH